MSRLLEYPSDPLPLARPAVRLLPDDHGVERSRAVLGVVLAVVLAAAYFALIFQFWAPAHSGVDQNGYLVGGRQLAATGSTGLKPEHPAGFVGAMWVRVAETGVHYPKYPIGLPLLYAGFLWAFGATPGGWGVTLAFLVSPVGAALSVLGVYLLARQFAGVYASVLAMILMAFSQVMLILANNPNSHAACLACCVWGVYLLMRFWQSGTIWVGGLAGFLLGYAVTIRYTEGLLGLLIALVALSMVHWRDWRSYLRAAVPTIGWLIPVGYLVGFNLVAMGTPTGYDTTNESVPGAAFTLEHVGQNWEKMLRQIHDGGLFFVLPLGVLGLIIAFAGSKRRAAVLWLWLVPGLATYMAYYWAPERGVSYLRFFLTLFPPLVVGAAIAFDQVLSLPTTAARRVVLPIACGVVVAFAAGMGAYRAVAGMEEGRAGGMSLESQLRASSNLYQLGQAVAAKVPDGSVLFAAQNDLHYLQFVGQYECYNPDYFTTAFVVRLKGERDRRDEGEANPRQPEQREALIKALEGFSDQRMIEEQNGVVDRALASGRRVFLAMPKAQADAFLRRYYRKSATITSHVVGISADFPPVGVAQAVEAERRPGNNNRQNRRGLFGNPPGGPPPAGGFGGERGQQTFQIVELTRAVQTAAK